MPKEFEAWQEKALINSCFKQLMTPFLRSESQPSFLFIFILEAGSK
jgi:hypothetical protein